METPQKIAFHPIALVALLIYRIQADYVSAIMAHHWRNSFDCRLNTLLHGNCLSLASIQSPSTVTHTSFLLVSTPSPFFSQTFDVMN